MEKPHTGAAAENSTELSLQVTPASEPDIYGRKLSGDSSPRLSESHPAIKMSKIRAQTLWRRHLVLSNPYRFYECDKMVVAIVCL